MSKQSPKSAAVAAAQSLPAMRHLTLDEDQFEDIREALLLGLSLLGEFQERSNVWEVLSSSGTELPSGLQPVDPTSGADDVTLFANALRFIHQFDRNGAAA